MYSTCNILTTYEFFCSWVKKFGEHNGLDVLMNILKACVSVGFTGKDALLRKIQHHCLKCIKAFMNNKVSLQIRIQNTHIHNYTTEIYY